MRYEPVCGVDPYGVPRRVLHVWQPTGGGVGRYVAEALRHQSGNGWEVHAAGPVDPGVAGVRFTPWQASRNPLRGLARETAQIAGLVRQSQPDVVVCHSAKAGLAVRLAVRGSLPTVYLPHAWSFSALNGPARQAAIAWERTAVRWTSATVAVGRGEAAEGMRAGVRAPTFVVPNPVPPGWTPITPQERLRYREELHLGAAPTAACIGRVSRQKGQDVLLRTWPRVLAEVPDAVLLVVGRGASALGDSGTFPSVAFFDESPEPRRFVGAADAIVQPSRWEGMSLSVLEAMSAGRSVVTTEVCGSEVVSESGAGAVVPIESEAGLAREIALRLRDPVVRADEGARGSDFAARHHDLDSALTRLAGVIVRAHAFGRPAGHWGPPA